MPSSLLHRHAWGNCLQTMSLILILLGIAALAGFLLFGVDGLWIALAASGIALMVEPAVAIALTLRLYRARPIAYGEAPALWQLMERIAERADLPAIPTLHYTPSTAINAFAVGSGRHAVIVLSEGLLRTLSLSEVASVLAHESAHIAHGDLRVMNLADYIIRLTAVFSLCGQILLLPALPWLLDGTAKINWIGLLLLAVLPHLTLAAQLGLSRMREFDADLEAAQLSGDPEGLAGALAKIASINRSWQGWLLPGWGNPDPSWLRTHPSTEELIRRLLLSVQASSAAIPRGVHAAQVQ